MPAGFSFNCPQCGKAYDNVKAKMAGRKVSCTCGKIFRLGPKTEEQVAKKAEKRAKKLAAKNPNNPPGRQASQNSAKAAPPSADSAKPVLSPKPFEAEIAGLDDEPFQAAPVPSSPELLPVVPGAFEDDPFVDIPDAEVYAPPVVKNSAGQPSPPPLGWALATPEPVKKVVRKEKAKRTMPIGGAIWTAIYALPFSLIQGLGVFALGGPGRRDSAGVTILLTLAGFISFILAVLIFISGVFAIIEIIKDKRIRWPSTAAAYAGVAMIGVNVLLIGIALVGISAGGAGQASSKAVGASFIMLIVMSVIPAAVAITGFLRNLPE